MPATSDYLSFVLSFPNLPPISILNIFLLGLMRIAPIVSIAPFLGSKLPGSTKIALAMALTVIFLPHLIATTTSPMHFNTAYLGLVVKELMMGLILAMLAAIPFYFAQSAGVLIDFLRGSSSLGVTDPSTQTQATPIGLLYNYVLIVLFFEINGPFLFFDAVLLSYTVIPVDSFINPAFFNLEQPFWKMMLHLLTDFTAISIQLAAPALVAILMAEMFLGIANRLAPQVQIAFIGMALKSLLGIAMLWAGWFFILQQLGQQVLLWLKNLDRVLHTLSR